MNVEKFTANPSPPSQGLNVYPFHPWNISVRPMLAFPLHRKNREKAWLQAPQSDPPPPPVWSFSYPDLSVTVKLARRPLKKALPAARLWTLAWHQEGIPDSSPQEQHTKYQQIQSWGLWKATKLMCLSLAFSISLAYWEDCQTGEGKEP